MIISNQYLLGLYGFLTSGELKGYAYRPSIEKRAFGKILR